MNQHIGNIRKVKPGMCTMLSAAVLLSAQSLVAQADPSHYEMVVFDKSRPARAVMNGNYDMAIEQAGMLDDSRKQSFEIANSLCVAYTVTRDFSKAEAACEAAVTATPANLKVAMTGLDLSRIDLLNMQAMARSNRGVLRAVSGDTSGALEDFEFAVALDSKVEAAEDNLARFKAVELSVKAVAKAE
jgi:hypothetical protein